ncbi:MAG: cysteine desulfurase NifS [Oscillospiraceae bacterium]|nr:cysteine desulfurase NifS [Oscillospiraceae bacterium]
MADRLIYLDHAATTPTRPEVVEAMMPYFTEHFGNASSIYRIGRDNRKAVDAARADVARVLGAEQTEIFFTGSGSEADNWAVKGAASARSAKGRHLITSAIEHPAVLEVFEWLAKNGYEVTYLPVDADGLVSPQSLRAAMRPDTTLVSIMMANNEIGTIQPIAELAAIAHEGGALFHTDAVQAAGNIRVHVRELGVDLLTISAHKFYGPKGIGTLYVRKGVRIDPLLHGGHQERGRRAGTENVPGIVGMARALTLAGEELAAHDAHLRRLRDMALEEITARVPHVKLNGHRTQRLPGNLNLSFRFIEGESLLLMLDMKGIAASSGSACTSGSLDPSHVLLAIGLPHEIAHGSLRLSFGVVNTEADVRVLVDELVVIVERLRQMSPLYEDFVRSGGQA